MRHSFASLLEKEKVVNKNENGKFHLKLDLTNSDQASTFEEDAASKRVLLYKHVPYGPITEKSAAHAHSIKHKGSLVTQFDIPTLVHRSIRQAQVDHQLLSPNQRIQQDVDDATAAAVAAASAVMSTAYGIRRTSVLITARGDGKGTNPKGRKESLSQLGVGGGGGGGLKRESRAGSFGPMASSRRPSSINAGSETSRTPTKSRSANTGTGNSFNATTQITLRPKVLMRVSVEGRRTEKDPTTGVTAAVYDLNGR